MCACSSAGTPLRTPDRSAAAPLAASWAVSSEQQRQSAQPLWAAGGSSGGSGSVRKLVQPFPAHDDDASGDSDCDGGDGEGAFRGRCDDDADAEMSGADRSVRSVFVAFSALEVVPSQLWLPPDCGDGGGAGEGEGGPPTHAPVRAPAVSSAAAAAGAAGRPAFGGPAAAGAPAATGVPTRPSRRPAAGATTAQQLQLPLQPQEPPGQGGPVTIVVAAAGSSAASARGRPPKPSSSGAGTPSSPSPADGRHSWAFARPRSGSSEPPSSMQPVAAAVPGGTEAGGSGGSSGATSGGSSGGTFRSASGVEVATGAAVGLEDAALVDLLRQRPKFVPMLRSRDSFRRYFAGISRDRMRALLTVAFDTLEAGERAEKVEKRMELLEGLLV
jgi:hypothetical protein